MVVYQYKWAYPLRAHPDLRNQVFKRYNAMYVLSVQLRSKGRQR